MAQKDGKNIPWWAWLFLLGVLILLLPRLFGASHGEKADFKDGLISGAVFALLAASVVGLIYLIVNLVKKRRK